MAMIDKLVLYQIDSLPVSRLSASEQREAEAQNNPDILETPSAWRNWSPGIRGVLFQRYLMLRLEVLQDLKQELDFTVGPAQIHQSIRQRLLGTGVSETGQRTASQAFWAMLLSRRFVVLLLLALSAWGLWTLFSNWKQRELTNAVKMDLPVYTDTVYQLAAEMHRDAPDETRITAHEDRIIELVSSIELTFRRYPAVLESLQSVMKAAADSGVKPDEMVKLTGGLNDEFHRAGLAFFVSPATEVSWCHDLPLERFIERLFGGETTLPGTEAEKTCYTHALMTFTVDEVRRFQHLDDTHLAYFTSRLDPLDIEDSLLGKVHIGDDKAQILLSNIAGASYGAVSTVLDGELRSRLMPKGMPDVYGLESIARRMQNRALDKYLKSAQSSIWQQLKSIAGEKLGNRQELKSIAVDRLQQRMADATAWHEVQHLIDQAVGLAEPPWLSESLDVFGARTANPRLREHILWELSAFFTHVAYAGDMQGVLLNELTAITLNPMLQDQPHFYSIRILFAALYQMKNGELELPVMPARTLGDVALAYKALSADLDALPELARQTYEVLFGNSLADITQLD